MTESLKLRLDTPTVVLVEFASGVSLEVTALDGLDAVSIRVTSRRARRVPAAVPVAGNVLEVRAIEP